MEVEEMRMNEAVISFGPEDLKGVNLPHNDALIIQARVANYDILRVFVDSGSFVIVIFKDALVQMDLQGFQLETVETALFGFVGHVVYPKGEIVLPLTLSSRDLKKTVMTTFTVIKFSVGSRVGEVRGVQPSSRKCYVEAVQRGDQPSSRKCYVEAVRGDQPSSRKCYVEAVRVDHSKARKERKKARTDEIGGRVVEKREVHFVAEEKQDIEELTGISPLISEHQLYILPRSHPVKQKKRNFGLEKDKVIDEHVRDLLKAGHIREIQFLTWLSNVVLVPKSTGKWRMCVDFRDLNKACPKDHYPLSRITSLR
ncbi:uncharacterized protein LOC142548372 [Primulina tabacum]|uniref:uncharacterized protein LOC142548372 n=1 Tax=Primulina tabacum TaxID=48773 RepID=UPI003F59CF26